MGQREKTWYAEAGADMQKLAKWKPENVVIEQSPAMTLQEEVETALKILGASSMPILTGARSIQLWMVRSIGSR
nr:hypothetical protein [Salmonella enterica]WCS70338.1 DNA primase [Salmonella enterica subsp. enterica serovar Rissen]